MSAAEQSAFRSLSRTLRGLSHEYRRMATEAATEGKLSQAFAYYQEARRKIGDALWYSRHARREPAI